LTVTTQPDSHDALTARRRFAHTLGKSQAWGLPQIAGLAVLFLGGSLVIQGYASQPSIWSMLVIASFLGIAAAGQTIVVLLGGIDLSIPFVIGAANVMLVQLSGYGWPLWAVLLAIVCMAVAVGGVNGLASRGLGIHPLIVTLATGAILQGSLLVWTGGNPSGSAPDWLVSAVSIISTTGPIPLPPLVVFWILLSIVLSVALSKFAPARAFYALGANPRAAHLALVRGLGAWVGGFIASALLASVAGIALAGFSSTGFLNIGEPYLFTSIAAVVIGGTSLLGARGNYWRTVLGTLMLIQIQMIMIGLGLSQQIQQLVLGLVIIAIMVVVGRGESLSRRI